MKKTVSVGVVSCLALLACLTLAGPAAAGTEVVAKCNPQKATKRPRAMDFACGDAGLQAVRIHWSSWGRGRARGRGRILMATCDPDCATGKLVRRRGRIELSRRVRCGHGLREYSRARVKPKGRRTIKIGIESCAAGRGG